MSDARLWKLVSISAQLRQYQQRNLADYRKNKRRSIQPIHGQDVSVDIASIRVIHPVTRTKDSLGNVIILLNDSYRWSREAIADWLDTLDEQPVFYPAIENTEITEEAATYYIREMVFGPASMDIKYACGCRISQESRKVTCGICWEIRSEQPFGSYKDGFLHSCQRHITED